MISALVVGRGRGPSVVAAWCLVACVPIAIWTGVCLYVERMLTYVKQCANQRVPLLSTCCCIFSFVCIYMLVVRRHGALGDDCVSARQLRQRVAAQQQQYARPATQPKHDLCLRCLHIVGVVFWMFRFIWEGLECDDARANVGGTWCLHLMQQPYSHTEHKHR